jgi:hypothetical protein
MTTQIADLVGLTEIAEMYGVDKNTANGWRRSPRFPSPVLHLAMGPAWDRNQVIAWREPHPDHRVSVEIRCADCGASFNRPPVLVADHLTDVTLPILHLKNGCDHCKQMTDMFVTFFDGRTSFGTEGWERK